MADYVGTVGLDISEALAEFDKLGPASRKAFSQAAGEAVRGARSVSAETAKAGKVAQNELGKKGAQAFESVKQAAEGLGGSVGGAAGMMEKFGRSIKEAGSALGPGGAAASAMAVTVAGLGYAISQVISIQSQAIMTTVQWARELENAGTNGVPAATAAVVEFGNSIDAASQLGKEFAVSALAPIAEASQSMVDVMLMAAVAVRSFTSNSDALAQSLVGAFAPGLALADAFGDIDRAATVLEAVFPGLRAEVDALKQSFSEETMAIDRNKASLFEQFKLTGAIEGAKRRAHLITLEQTEAEKRQAEAVRKQAEAIREQEQATRDRIRADQEYFSAWMSQQQQQQQFRSEVAALADAEHAAHMRRISDEQQAELRSIDERLAKRRMMHDIALNLETSLASSVQTLAYNQAQAIADSEELTMNQKRKRIHNAFAAQQAAAVSRAIIESADAYMGMVAFFAPFLGPGAFLAAGTAVAPVLAAQLSTIKSQKPPTFPTGGMVGDQVDGDHVLIGAQRNEAVITSRGVDSLGGPAGVAAVNAGMGGMPRSIRLELGPGVLAEAILNDRPTQAAILRLVGRSTAGRF